MEVYDKLPVMPYELLAKMAVTAKQNLTNII